MKTERTKQAQRERGRQKRKKEESTHFNERERRERRWGNTITMQQSKHQVAEKQTLPSPLTSFLPSFPDWWLYHRVFIKTKRRIPCIVERMMKHRPSPQQQLKQQQQQMQIRKLATSRTSSSMSWLLLTTGCLLLSFLSLVQSAIVVTQDEKTCLEETGKLFENNDALIAARHNYAESMEMDMTTISTMTASYPDNLLDTYKSKCSSNGGQMHVIKIDFFDCTLRKMNREVELTLKNFANCLAAIPECERFDQENLLEEAWEDMGLHCELEEAPGGGSSSGSSSNNNNNNVKPTPAPKPVNNDDDAGFDALDDDLANQEKEEEDAAKKGASNEAVPYVPKEEQGKSSSSSSSSSTKKKKKSGFWTFLLLASVGGYAFYMHKQGRLRTFRGQVPFGGVTTSRFQERGPFSGGSSGFGLGSETSYNLVGGGNGEEEFNFNPSVDNDLQLSSNLM